MLGILVKEMFARVAVTKPHTLRGLHSRNQFSHGARGQKGRVRVSAGLVSAEASLGAFPCSSLCVRLSPAPLFSEGHESAWISAQPNDLVLM